MNEENIDDLTRELLKKSYLKPSSSFEDGLMSQIEMLPIHGKELQTNSRYNFLWLSIGLMICPMAFFLDYFHYINFSTFFISTTLLLRLPIDEELMQFSYFPFLILMGFCFFYFLDLFLIDYFGVKRNKSLLVNKI